METNGENRFAQEAANSKIREQIIEILVANRFGVPVVEKSNRQSVSYTRERDVASDSDIISTSDTTQKRVVGVVLPLHEKGKYVTFCLDGSAAYFEYASLRSYENDITNIFETEQSDSLVLNTSIKNLPLSRALRETYSGRIGTYIDSADNTELVTEAFNRALEASMEKRRQADENRRKADEAIRSMFGQMINPDTGSE